MSEPRRPVDAEAIRVVRVGHGANCSSIGSVVDTLFVTALAGGAVFAAICAALDREPIRVHGSPARASDPSASPASLGDRDADRDEEEVTS